MGSTYGMDREASKRSKKQGREQGRGDKAGFVSAYGTSFLGLYPRKITAKTFPFDRNPLCEV